MKLPLSYGVASHFSVCYRIQINALQFWYHLAQGLCKKVQLVLFCTFQLKVQMTKSFPISSLNQIDLSQ